MFGTYESISILEKKIKMFTDGTNPTAGIDEDNHDRFTAILNFPKIEVVLNLLLTLVVLFFYTCLKCKTGRAY